MRENRVYENNFLVMDFIAKKLRFEKSKCKKKEGKSYKTKNPHQPLPVRECWWGLNLVLLSLLAIVGIRTMFAVIVLLYQEWIHCRKRVDRETDKRHLGTLLHDLCVIYGIVW